MDNCRTLYIGSGGRVSVNVTIDEGEVIATRLKKLLIMTWTCGVTRLERTEMKINLSKQILMSLNKLLTTKLSRKNLIDQ